MKLSFFLSALSVTAVMASPGAVRSLTLGLLHTH
jgi:hypothetical protein